ncbi:hypothetical protein [Kitasatospora sp. NPDC004272]
MSELTTADLQRLAEEVADRNHPHFVKATAADGGTYWYFKPFTGDEPRPQRLAGLWFEPDLAHEAKQFLDDQYDVAAQRWDEAHLTQRMQHCTTTVAAAWTALTAARQEMHQAFTNLAQTDDTRWRSAVFQLVTAQTQALKAATTWDAEASGIVGLIGTAERRLLWGLEDFQRLGVDPAWPLGPLTDYQHHTERECPMHRQVSADIERQREHVRTVDSLASNRT